MIDPDHPLAELLRRDRRYHRNAYFFVFEALRYAQEQLGLGQPTVSDDPALEEQRHVTGQQLCEAMRRYAHQQYGYLAKQVLNHWGIRSTEDLGRIVFLLIDVGLLAQQPSDRIEDFDRVYDFAEVFATGYRWSGLERA